MHYNFYIITFSRQLIQFQSIVLYSWEIFDASIVFYWFIFISFRECLTINLNKSIYVTWSREMSRMSEILFLSYGQKQCSNSFVSYCFGNDKFCIARYLNQISNIHGVCIKTKHFEVLRRWRKKIGIDIFQQVNLYNRWTF